MKVISPFGPKIAKLKFSNKLIKKHFLVQKIQIIIGEKLFWCKLKSTDYCIKNNVLYSVLFLVDGTKI